MSNRQKYLLISTVSLFLGGLCYILLRSDTYVSQIFCLHTILNIQTCKFLCFYLPDFLWCVALSMCLMWVYDPDFSGRTLCAGCAFVCGCIWELLQYIGPVGGTADLLDIAMYLLASISATLLSGKVRNET